MKINLKIKLKEGIEIELSNDEVKELKYILDELYDISLIKTFKTKELIKVYHPNWEVYPEITCDTNNISLDISLKLVVDKN